MKHSKAQKTLMTCFFILFVLYSISLIFPFLWMLVNSFKTNQSFFQNIWAFPKKLMGTNYVNVWKENNLALYFFNSIKLTTFCTFFSVVIPASTAYVIAKYEFKFKKLIYTLAISTMLLPSIGTIAALYKFMVVTKLFNTHIGIILLYTGGFGFNFVLLYGFFKSVSWSYAEAAFVDGATDWVVFYKVMLPQAKGGIGAAALLTGIQVWNDYYTPFMFLESKEKFPLAVGLNQIVMEQTYSADWPKLFAAMIIAKDTGNFQCSDALHNKIYEVCLRTLKLSVHEHYEDCPWREQAMYTMDSRNQMLCGYYAFGEYDMPKASLRLMTLGQRESGLLELCAPSRVSITIPMLSLSYVTAVYEYAVYSGDYPFVREIMPAVKRVMTAFSSRLTKDNLLSRFTEKEYWNFYEWQDGLDGGLIERDYDITPRLEAPLNGFFAIALQQFACLCDMLNLREDKQWAQDIYGRVKTAINTCFWNESQGSYCSYIEDGKQIHYAELTQALLVCGGVVPEERKAQVLHLLAYPSEKLLPVTLSCTIYKYEALMTETEKYAKLIFNEIQQKWGNMLFSGATSFWETEKGSWDFDNAGSLCHGWSAIPIYYYYAYGLGISPFTTDYKNIDCGLIGAVGNDCLKIHAKVGGK